MSLALTAYRWITAALTPIIPFALTRRARRGKEDALRLREKLGHAGVTRPAGQLIWIHGASVGECLSVLPLIDELLKTPNRTVLVTSGTVTSAKLLSERLPSRAVHQYAPVDAPLPIRRFLDHWRPDLALFVDSEIWPNLISSTHNRNIPVALINGRMSSRSFSGWKRLPKTAAAVLGRYDLCLAQDKESAERLIALGAKRVELSGNLKADAPPLPAGEQAFAELRSAIGTRPVLLAASTHRGEEETILPAQDRLRQKFPDLLTIIVPRHPIRGDNITMLCGTRSSAQRSRGELPSPSTEIYVADTMGELGVFFRLAPFAFIGGSLVPHGGQNPLEAAQLARAVLAGPYTQNFKEAYDAIFAAQGAGRVFTSSEIADLAEKLIADPGAADAFRNAAAEAARSLGGAVERTRSAIEALLAHARA